MPTSTPTKTRRTTPAKKPAPPTSTLVLLVRHGTTPTTGQVLPGRASGLHLSEKGEKEAATVAARLADWAGAGRPPAARNGKRSKPRVAAVYASPLERTQETAAAIVSALGLSTVTEPGLLECDFGSWTGAELKQLMKKPEWTTVQRYPSGFRFPEGESFTSMQARIVDTIAALCQRHRGERIVAVSHADPIKAAVADALGSHLDLFQRIVISPCSVTAIAYGPVGPTVLAVNSTSDLTDLVPS
jgi:probable phosphomutase (TIGR03848 family)